MDVGLPRSSRFDMTVAYFISADLRLAAYAANSAHRAPPENNVCIIHRFLRFGKRFHRLFLFFRQK